MSERLPVARILALVALLGAAVPASARYIQNWMLDPQEVASRSDLIVVATALASTTVGPSTNGLPGLVRLDQRWVRA